MTGIEEVDALERKQYTVTFAYAGFDSHNDKSSAFDEEPDVWVIQVWAVSTMDSIVRAKQILDIERGEIATDWHSHNPEMRNGMSKQELDRVYNGFLDRHVFKHWMLMEPTSIQAHLTVDDSKLRNMTIDNIIQITEGIGDEAESYLKGENDVT